MTAHSARAANDIAAPNDLDACWLPFTANRSFKQRPAHDRARQGTCTTITPEGREVLDGAAGLWCCNAGHNREPKSSAAIQKQAAELDYSPRLPVRPSRRLRSSRRGSPSWRRATSTTCSSAIRARKRPTPRSRSRSPIGTCSGQGSRTRLIGRERGYHGVGFGGISVGGIVNNRKFFGTLLAGVDHLPHTYNRARTGVFAGRAGMGRASGRRARAHRGAARRLHHRRRHRRADGRLHRRAAAAEGLPAAPARRSATSTASC